jgi:ABC-type transporter Mla subunit MlaD
MRRVLGIFLVLVVAAGVAVTVAGRSQRESKGFRFKIAFDNAFGLTEGGDLRIGGVKAGRTTKFHISKGPECQGSTPGDGPPRTCAIVDSQITEEGFKDLRTDAKCDVRQQSLIGEYYVDCQPGHAPGQLAPNSTITDTHTGSTIPADLVNDILRRPYRDRLRLIIAELGTGLAGRPQDVSELLKRADPGLRETRKVLQILGNQREIIKNFISNSNTVVRELDKKKHDLQRWVVESGRAAEVSASRREAIAAGFQRLPTFLDELRGTMVRLEDLTDAQTPLLRDLHTAAPDLTTFFKRLGSFSEASRPAFRSLGDLSTAGIRAVRNSRDEIAMLRKLASYAPGTAKPLRQLLQTLDNRKRSTENNPMAAQTAPPRPDPTSNARGRGFTGFEALLSYPFWQVLSLNQFDNVGHVLRAVLLADPECGDFLNDLKSTPEERRKRRCANFLGPNQPGITTRDIGHGAGRTRAKSVGERRGAGQPEAGPLPGQVDWSKPHPSLPASQQELLDSLRGGKPATPQAPSAASGAGGSDVSHVLDYLMSP